MDRRGPDGWGEWISADSRVGFAHRRLAIIDLSGNGAQPMASEDGKLRVVFNGEIYNHRELRRELEQKGVRFRSQSDTEVLLYLYRFWGREMVRRLRGMFAFAIWDEVLCELFLARDPYGIKPLYFADDGRTFRFASQVTALRAGGAVAGELDPAGTAGFFLWGSVPEPFTLYRAVRSLPAGSMLTVSNRGAGARKVYWNIQDTVTTSISLARAVRLGEEAEYVREALIDSVAAHMVSDVPVGAFLSAGLDSSTVVGLAREVSEAPLKTITLAFDEFENRDLDEAPVAQAIARHLGVEHQERRITLAEVDAELPKFFSAMDQPTIDGFNTWLVSKAAAEAHLKVALSGLGGDELLGGYATFQDVPRLAQAQPAVGSTFPREPLEMIYSRRAVSLPLMGFAYSMMLKHRCGYLGAYQSRRGLFMPWELGQVLERDFAAQGLTTLGEHERNNASGGPVDENGFARVVALESSRYMRNQLLRDTDWTGMAHSLEIRVPLVDRVLTEAIAGLAVSGRLGERKAILHRMLSRGLPEAATRRPKTGFTVPIWRWLNKSAELAAWKALDVLRSKRASDQKRWAYSLFSRMPESSAVLLS
jgi:asparagine synthase (glutamine-hydrolysing)